MEIDLNIIQQIISEIETIINKEELTDNDTNILLQRASQLAIGASNLNADLRKKINRLKLTKLYIKTSFIPQEIKNNVILELESVIQHGYDSKIALDIISHTITKDFQYFVYLGDAWDILLDVALLMAIDDQRIEASLITLQGFSYVSNSDYTEDDISALNDEIKEFNQALTKTKKIRKKEK